MKDPTRYCILLFFLLLILSHQTSPQIHIPKGNASGKWLEQHTIHYIGDSVRVICSKKIIPDTFYITSQYKPVNKDQRRYFDIAENGKPINLNSTYGEAYQYQSAFHYAWD